MSDTDMLYMASLEKRNAELEAKVAELEDKHWNECRQIAHYEDELRKAKELLKAAVEDIKFYVDCYEAHCDECCCDQNNHCHWKHEAEALTLIGEDINVPVREDGEQNDT
mgnify:CR=1 FL=1